MAGAMLSMREFKEEARRSREMLTLQKINPSEKNIKPGLNFSLLFKERLWRFSTFYLSIENCYELIKK